MGWSQKSKTQKEKKQTLAFEMYRENFRSHRELIQKGEGWERSQSFPKNC